MLQNFPNLRIAFQEGPNSTLELVNSSWKEIHVVPNLSLDCMLCSSIVPYRPMRLLTPNLGLVEMKTDYIVHAYI